MHANLGALNLGCMHANLGCMHANLGCMHANLGALNDPIVKPAARAAEFEVEPTLTTLAVHADATALLLVPRAHDRERRLIASAPVSAEDEPRGGHSARHLRRIFGGLGRIDHCPRIVVVVLLLLLLHSLVVLVLALELHRVVVVERLPR
jgi:hypothetical protein